MIISTKKPEPPKILYCVYARKSMEAEERQAISIDSQLNEMKVIADRDRLNIVAIKTESHSAKDSGQRPVFREIIDGIKNQKFNAILTWNPDRLSRNAGDLGQIVDLMDKGLLQEIRTYGQLFTNSPNDKFLLMILCSQAKLENDNRGINVKRGLRTKVEMGLFPFAIPPMGYKKSNIKGEECIVFIDQERAPRIKEIFEKIAYQKQSIRGVMRWLRSIDFRSPTGKFLNLTSVQDILRRPFYYGHFEYPKKSGKWYKGVHEPIITQKLFEDAKEAIARFNRRKKYRYSKTAPFGFLRIMKCGSCGSGISAEEKYKHRKKSEDVAIYRYYVCSRSRNRDCNEPYINEKQLMAEFYKVLDRVDIDLIGMRELMELEIDKSYKIQAFAMGESVQERGNEKKELDLRIYAKIIFEEGRIEEQREILKLLTSRLILKNKRIYIDSVEEVKTI